MKKYTNPKLNVTIFDTESICTASGDTVNEKLTATQAEDAAAVKANGAVSVSWDNVKITF